MRYTIIVIGLLLASCSNIGQTAESKLPADSIAKFEKIAFGDLKFGENKKQATKKIAMFSSKIGCCEYEFTPTFNSGDSLCELTINTKENYSSLIGAKDAWENLLGIIIKKFGQPEQNDGFPTNEAEYYASNERWSVGRKIIRLSIASGKHYPNYTVECAFSDLQMSIRKSIKDSNDEKARKQKSLDSASNQL